MKKILFSLVLGAGIISCNTADKKTDAEKTREAIVKDSITREKNNQILNDVNSATSIQWLDSTFTDLGKVKEGKVVEVAFRFKNTGNKPLIITDVTASCGCTIPEKPEEPFAPGQEGVIKAKFDSRGRVGEARKEIHVVANTIPSSSHTLTFRVEVTN
jgi:hypothetical protein